MLRGMKIQRQTSLRENGKLDYEVCNGNLRQLQRLEGSRSTLAGRKRAYAKSNDENVILCQKAL
jgi:hypothetical protein